MMSPGGPWALALAAGEGNRLRTLTTDPQGNSVPKQFCSLGGAASLLQLALHRATHVATRERTAVIVAAQHEHWWRAELAGLPASNVIVQPRNRGTAVGVLLPLLHLLRCDPEARIVLLPSDHFVAHEPVLASAMRRALAEVERHPERLVLLGITPDEPDSQLGWIVPDRDDAGEVRRVSRFVEKPPTLIATELMARGGVWNSLILAVDGQTLLGMFETRMPAVVRALRAALGRVGDVEAVYGELDSCDFSRDVLEPFERSLSVLPVPPCGWSDLGTPERVARCIERHPQPVPAGVALREVATLDLVRASLLRAGAC